LRIEEVHSGELHNSYSSPNTIRQIKSRRMRVGGTCGTYGRGEKSVQDFVGKLKGKRELRRPRHRWEDGIRIDLREIGWECMEWIQLA
jgi:hypothetical protein